MPHLQYMLNRASCSQLALTSGSLVTGDTSNPSVLIGHTSTWGPKPGCDDDDDNALPVAVWAAIGAGAAVALMVVLCCICLCCRRRNRQKHASAQNNSWQAHEENGNGQQHESLIAASVPSVQQVHESGHQVRGQPAISPVVQPLPYQEQMNEMSKVSSVPEAVKHSTNVTSTATSFSQREVNQGASTNSASAKRYTQANTAIDPPPAQHVVHADIGASEDEELEGDPGPGPTMYDGKFLLREADMCLDDCACKHLAEICMHVLVLPRFSRHVSTHHILWCCVGQNCEVHLGSAGL